MGDILDAGQVLARCGDAGEVSARCGGKERSEIVVLGLCVTKRDELRKWTGARLGAARSRAGPPAPRRERRSDRRAVPDLSPRLGRTRIRAWFERIGLSHRCVPRCDRVRPRESRLTRSALANLPDDAVEPYAAILRTGVHYGYAVVHPNPSLVPHSTDDTKMRGIGEVLPMVMSVGWNPFYKNTRRTAVRTLPSLLPQRSLMTMGE